MSIFSAGTRIERLSAAGAAGATASGTGWWGSATAPLPVALGRAQQGIDVRGRQRALVARVAEQVLHDVRERADVGEPDHARGALDGVDIAEQRVDGVGRGVAALEREQRVDDAIQPPARPEDLEELAVGLAHDACPASAPNSRSTSMIPTSSPSSRNAPLR